MNNNKQISAIGTPVTFLQLVDIAFTKSCTLWTLGLVFIVFFVNSVLGHESMSRFVQLLSIYTSNNFITWWNMLRLSFWMPPVILCCSVVVFNFMRTVIQKWNNLDEDIGDIVSVSFIFCVIVAIIFSAIYCLLRLNVFSDRDPVIISVVCSVIVSVMVSILIRILQDFTITIVFFILTVFASHYFFSLLEILKFQAVWIILCVFVFGSILTLIAISRLRILRDMCQYM